MAAISFEQVHQKYMTLSGETTALTGIDLRVEEGEFVGLVGPSGCGKSTILSLIAGLLTPTGGSVRVNGSTAYMFQQDNLLPWRTALDNILLGPEIAGRITPEVREKALGLLEEMGLAHASQLYPHQLSGGMRQRVALVRTLTADPHIVLLDEPFSALDYQIKLQLEELVATTLKNRRLTGLLVTHDLGEAVAMCDRIVIMSGKPGRIKRVMAVPENIRLLHPMEAREAPEFHELFRAVWGDLQDED